MLFETWKIMGTPLCPSPLKYQAFACGRDPAHDVCLTHTLIGTIHVMQILQKNQRKVSFPKVLQRSLQLFFDVCGLKGIEDVWKESQLQIILLKLDVFLPFFSGRGLN